MAETSERAPTLADVARGAGVAISTVSRALTKPGRVNDRTQARIERIARELNYEPPGHGNGRAAGRTRSVAVLVSDVTNPFYFGIIRGTQSQLQAAGYVQLLINTEESDEFEDSMLLGMRSSFDGAILAASRLTDRRLTALSSEIPLVAINRQTRGVANIFIDTPGGVEQAIAHLASLGHTTIVYAAGPETSWSNERRWKSFVRAAEQYTVQAKRIGPFSPRQHSGAAAADAFLHTGASACIAFNDLLAIGMLARFRERQIRVPEDVSLVGCDDIFGADFCNPPLTTLTAPIEQAGRSAVAMLLTRLGGSTDAETRPSTILPTHLTVRGSTGPAFTQG